MKVSIYLAGKIKKKHENPNETYWTDEDMSLRPFAKKPNIFLKSELFSEPDSDHPTPAQARAETQKPIAHLTATPNAQP